MKPDNVTRKESVYDEVSHRTSKFQVLGKICFELAIIMKIETDIVRSRFRKS
jgi:hypothetical protein